MKKYIPWVVVAMIIVTVYVFFFRAGAPVVPETGLEGSGELSKIIGGTDPVTCSFQVAGNSAATGMLYSDGTQVRFELPQDTIIQQLSDPLPPLLQGDATFDCARWKVDASKFVAAG